MPELPSGTVTFLFTDIEGSTRAWEREPEAMRLALERHDAILRESVHAHRGHVFKTIGDAYCAAFHTPPDALAAALAAQLALHAEPGGQAGPLRVRMALNVGAAELRNGDYAGPALNRVARLLSVGHGGQTLMSQAVYDLVGDSLADGVELRSLGEHSLKDLQQPLAVYQLLHPALPADFPPLRSLNVLPNNLPLQLTNFIGREREMGEIKRLLAGTRLLTLTGAGGSGKTRLALQVAAELLDDFPDGVWLVELATLAEPTLVAPRVASALSVREQSGRPLTDTLAEYLKSRKLLLVLDSCEHLLQGCVDVASRVLLSCAGVKILATSREALNVTGEASWTVPPLSAPDPRRLPTASADVTAAVSRYEAVRLFVDRALLNKSDFALTDRNAAAVGQICHRLDGIPLAIELAAARVKVLSVEQIAARLDDRFRLLTGGSRMMLPRHQTLRAAIDWSYELLSEPERVLLRRLSVFAGGWTLEAAENVCAGEGVESWEVLELQARLVEKSLVLVEEGLEGETRYHLLGTIRQYARDRLIEAGEAGRAHGRHRDWCLEFAEHAGSELRGPDQPLWLDRLEQEHDNLRAAIEWSCAECRPEGLVYEDRGDLRGSRESGQADEGSPEAGLRLAGSLYRFWWVRGHLTEGRQWLEGALLAAGLAAGPGPRARALHGAGYLAWAQGDYPRARSHLAESLALYRRLDDKRGLARALNSSAVLSFDEGEQERARSLWEEGLSVARDIGARDLVGSFLNNLGEVARMQGEYERAKALYEESLEASGEAPTYARGLTLFNLGQVAWGLEEWMGARSFYSASLALSRKLGDRLTSPSCLEGMAGVCAMEDRHLEGARLLGAAEALRKALNAPVQSGDRVHYERCVAAVRGGLSESAFAAAWAEGGAMTLEQAIDYALTEDVSQAGSKS
jgi:predicted ATPase/class 3 adenylate cyclase